MTDSQKKILVVDDEPQISRVLKGYLENAGFQVISSQDGKTALTMFDRDRPDFVILDLNLPGLDGLEICRSIRQTSDIPILMLTARSEEADKIVGLELGADDYIVKPFSPREIVARVKTIFRRVNSEKNSSEIIQIGALTIDSEKHVVVMNGQKIDLTPTEFDLLSIMARQPRRVFSRQQLLENITDIAYEGYDRTIDTHIKNIRNKLESDPKKPRIIHTVFGLGYKFEMSEDEK